MVVLTGILVLVLAAMHILAGSMRFLNVTPRSIWLSIAGGVSVAYVFMHLLPELSAGEETIRQTQISAALPYVERHAYMLALLGLAVFYGLERAAQESRRRNSAQQAVDLPSPGVFWLHIGSFSFYNVLIGYALINRIRHTVLSVVFYTVAMGLHFVVNDHGLRAHFQKRYDRLGRWILSLAVIAGWPVGLVITLSEAGVALVFAFLAGGVVLNVLKEELPEERESRFWAFGVGAMVYAFLLLTV